MNTSLVPLERNRAIELFKIDNEYRIDSRIISKGIGIGHRYFIRLLRQPEYLKLLEKMGLLRFENAKPQGGRPEIYAMLNRNQAAFAITLSRNTEQVVQFKFDLIVAFDLATSELHSTLLHEAINIEQLDQTIEKLRTIKRLAKPRKTYALSAPKAKLVKTLEEEIERIVRKLEGRGKPPTFRDLGREGFLKSVEKERLKMTLAGMIQTNTLYEEETPRGIKYHIAKT